MTPLEEAYPRTPEGMFDTSLIQWKSLDPLEHSIEHWQRMHDHPAICDSYDETPQGRSCPLCRAYQGSQPRSCMRCPIMLRTGKDGCQDTPWGDAWDAWTVLWEDFDGGDRDEYLRLRPHQLDKWERASQVMIDFLKSLRLPTEPAASSVP